jgi:hypothetical protein
MEEKMKKIILTFLAIGLLTSPAFALPWSWDLSGTGFSPSGLNVTGNIIDFQNDIGVVSAPNSVSRINQSFTGGADDSILDNGDTFTEFGIVSAIDSDNSAFLLDGGSSVAYIEFTGLAGSISNYDSGTSTPSATTFANYGTHIADDSFDLTFTPGAGTIKFYLDDDFDSTNGGNTLEIAELTLLAGQGTSPEFLLGEAEGQFGLVAGFTSVLPDFWTLTGPDVKFEDWMAQYGIPSIFATSFNLGATLESIGDDGADIVLGVTNEGSFEISAVPEPSTFILLGGGLLGLSFYARRKKK